MKSRLAFNAIILALTLSRVQGEDVEGNYEDARDRVLPSHPGNVVTVDTAQELQSALETDDSITILVEGDLVLVDSVLAITASKHQDIFVRCLNDVCNLTPSAQG